jgi:predicted HAD superfamily Cof-like phosphohydrolase
MKELIAKVKNFHNTFGHEVNNVPTKIDYQGRNFRFSLLREENSEYLVSSTLEDQADAIGDSLFVLIGTIIVHGLEDKIEDIFNAIYESNMSKLDENNKPIINGVNTPLNSAYPFGKILKSDRFKDPTEAIKSILGTNNGEEDSSAE